MATSNESIVIYRVVARYMMGQNVTAYHFVGSNGSQVKASSDKVIYMIGKGLIENMRVQSGKDGSVIIRGKGVNLLELPVMDENKNQIRETASNSANGDKQTGNKKANNIGQLTITKRIIQKTSCLGYMVEDASGKELKLSRSRVIDLALQGVISNATAHKYTPKGKESVLILRGTGEIDLDALPELVVDQSGQIIDPSNAPIRIRVVKMKRGGIVHNKENESKILFNNGDYLTCGINAEIKCIKAEEMASNLTPNVNDKNAICDDSFDNLGKYELEIFGQPRIKLTTNMVTKWNIANIVKAG